MLAKILLVLAMIVMGHVEGYLTNFMKKTEKRLEELQSKMQDLSDENMMKMEKRLEELQSMMQDLSDKNAELKAENSELKIALDEDLQEMNENFQEMNEDFQDMKTENTKLKKDIQKLKMESTDLKVKDDELQCKAEELVREVSSLKNPPFYHICVYRRLSSDTSSNVDFEKELYFSCLHCENANFDLASGVYTNGWPGTYTVTWDLRAGNNPGESDVKIYLKKNGTQINESEHRSDYSGSKGHVYDQGKLSSANFTECLLNFQFPGGRTMILRMETGDTLSLYCRDCSAFVSHITFCISLNTFDVL